jgi:AraC-like DNA-binding protein
MISSYGTTMAYRWDLLPRLAEGVEHGLRARALADLEELFAEIDAGVGGDFTLFVLRCAQCMSACLRGARRGGGPSEALYDEHHEALARLGRLRARAQVRRLLRWYVGRLLDQVQPSNRTRMERIVLGIRADLAATLARPRTLAGYARDLELSVGHLSRAFARIAGRPFRDELLRLRDEAARRLLTDTRLGVGEIAERVGLRSASQFIADFRRAHGVTPARYRDRRVRRRSGSGGVAG